MAEDLTALLAHLPGCELLPPESRHALERVARLERFAAGARLVAEGEPAPDWYGVIQSGAVRLSRLDTAAGEALESLTAGDVLDPGDPGAPARWSATALEPVACLLVPQAVVLRHRLGPGTVEGYRGDIAFFVRSVRDVMRSAPLTCPPGTEVAEAARRMTRQAVGSILVVDDGGRLAGIVTDRDLRRRVLAAGRAPTTPVAAVASAPVLTIAPERMAFDALLEMTRANVHHLAVVEDERPVGVVSSHDLLGLEGSHPVVVARAVEAADSVERLEAAAPGVSQVVRWLAGNGASALDIGRIVAELNDRLVRRAVDLAEAALPGEGHGEAPAPYSWLAAGSEGRREQTLRTDQDNGLIWDDAAGAAPAAAAWFERLAARVGQVLERLGFPPCPGGYMASRAHWCQPATVWRGYFDRWMQTPQPAAVLEASIYFDLRPVAGRAEPGVALSEWACDRAPGAVVFLRHLARDAVQRRPPLGLFGGFVVERGGVHKDRLDLKARGLFPVTQAMRVLALSLGVRETNTMDRLAAAGTRGALPPAEVVDIRETFALLSRLRLRHQLDCLDAGRAPDNHVDPRALGSPDRLLLKEAFRTVERLQRTIEDRFQTATVL